MIYFYGQNVAICALAGSLIIAGTITFFLPAKCDLVSADKTAKAGKPASAALKSGRGL